MSAWINLFWSQSTWLPLSAVSLLQVLCDLWWTFTSENGRQGIARRTQRCFGSWQVTEAIIWKWNTWPTNKSKHLKLKWSWKMHPKHSYLMRSHQLRTKSPCSVGAPGVTILRFCEPWGRWNGESQRWQGGQGKWRFQIAIWILTLFRPL